MAKLKFGSRKSGNKLNKASETDTFAVDFTGSNTPAGEDKTKAGKKRKIKPGNPFRRIGRKNTEPAAETQDGFTVNVRNTAPMLEVGTHKASRRNFGILRSVPSALVMAAALSMFLLTADAYTTIPFVLAGVVMYFIVTVCKTKVNERFRVLILLLLAVGMIAALIVLRKYMANGLALIVNAIFERSEEAQAYVYDMYSIGSKGESNPELCMGIATAWVSAAAGYIFALPGEKWRGLINTLIFIALMLCYAYFGVIPMWAGMMVLIAAFLLSAGSGRLNSAWPIILAVLLVFGGITLLDPGENYTVSRANENLRDMFALKTAQIQGLDDSMMEEEYEEEDETEWESDDSEFYEDESEQGSITTLILILMIPVVLILAALVWLHIRLAKKRKRIRADLDSKDPKTAIGAMFPYAVRWLQCLGINVSNTAFSELIPDIKAGLDKEYVDRYDSMMKMWREAVFSDHELTEANRMTMASFMKDTINIAKKKSGWKEKLKVRFKYAL